MPRDDGLWKSVGQLELENADEGNSAAVEVTVWVRPDSEMTMLSFTHVGSGLEVRIPLSQSEREWLVDTLVPF